MHSHNVNIIGLKNPTPDNTREPVPQRDPRVLWNAERRAPDLYRYFCPVLAEDETGYEILSEVFELEQRMARSGAITLIGHRFVGISQPAGAGNGPGWPPESPG